MIVAYIYAITRAIAWPFAHFVRSLQTATLVWTDAISTKGIGQTCVTMLTKRLCDSRLVANTAPLVDCHASHMVNRFGSGWREG